MKFRVEVIVFVFLLIISCTLTFSQTKFLSNFTCHENGFVHSITTSTPHHSLLVQNVFQSTLIATVWDIDQFVKYGSEFSVCLTVTRLSVTKQIADTLAQSVEDLTSVKEAVIRNSVSSSYFEDIFDESCHSDVFGHYSIRAASGINHINLRLNYGNEVICNGSLLVFCCLADFPEFLESSTKQHEKDILGNYLNNSKHILSSDPISLRAPETNPNRQGKLRIIIGIKSFSLNIHLRNIIRRTYIQRIKQIMSDIPEVEISYYFLIGYSPFISSNRSVQFNLFQEKFLYEDILLEDELPIEDNFYLLTEKVVSFLSWVWKKKLLFDYLLITDDDTYLNIYSLIHLLVNQQEKRLSQINLQDYSYYAGEVYYSPIFLIFLFMLFVGNGISYKEGI